MLVFSSLEITQSFSPSGCPSHWPAYKSRIGPALAANAGSRGKIQCSYCHGFRPSSCSRRQTVLRLIGFPSSFVTRLVKSDSDWRLIGKPVVATVSHAKARTSAWSSGGKSGLAPPANAIRDGIIPDRPALSPTLYLPCGQPQALSRRLIGQRGLLMQEQHQAETLHS